MAAASDEVLVSPQYGLLRNYVQQGLQVFNRAINDGVFDDSGGPEDLTRRLLD
ncbi:MAG: hypothetical protein KDA93_09665 [Planctomycetaceae bacterium]|nr:hypothetical protein [Planctomycetaceae bacterium]